MRRKDGFGSSFRIDLTNETIELLGVVICLRCANEINVWVDSYATKINIDMED